MLCSFERRTELAIYENRRTDVNFKHIRNVMEQTSSLPRATCGCPKWEPTTPQPVIQIPTVGVSQTEHEDGCSTIYSGMDRDRFSLKKKQREKRAIQKLELHHLEQRLKMAQLQARETKKNGSSTKFARLSSFTKKKPDRYGETGKRKRSLQETPREDPQPLRPLTSGRRLGGREDCGGSRKTMLPFLVLSNFFINFPKVSTTYPDMQRCYTPNFLF